MKPSSPPPFGFIPGDLQCKGCYGLGSACGKCARCLKERREMRTEGESTPTHEEAIAQARQYLPRNPFQAQNPAVPAVPRVRDSQTYYRCAAVTDATSSRSGRHRYGAQRH